MNTFDELRSPREPVNDGARLDLVVLVLLAAVAVFTLVQAEIMSGVRRGSVAEVRSEVATPIKASRTQRTR